MIDLVRTLAVLIEPPEPQHRPLWEHLELPAPSPADHTELFSIQLFPYASVHLGAEGRLGGEARDRIAGFFRVLGLAPAPDCDHLAVLLGAYAALLEREQHHERTHAAVDRVAGWRRAREALLVEHLLAWMPGFVHRVEGLANGSYRTWAGLVDEVLAAEAARTPGARMLLPVHLAQAPPLPDPRSGAVGDFVDGLLAPARAGMILTAADLARAGVDLGLGRRVGERRFVLRSLLDQDPAPVLGWLAAAAASDVAWWDAHWLGPTPIGRWWHARAGRSAALLHELAADAQRAEGPYSARADRRYTIQH